MHIYLMYKNDWIKGSLRTILLKLLNEHSRLYGYEITQLVQLRSDNSIRITEGALYPSLHKLESQGYLLSKKVLIGKRVRKYYSLTSAGQKEAQDNIEEYFSFVRTMLVLLSNKTPTTS